jgi:ABC-2 type transport system permease protein
VKKNMILESLKSRKLRFGGYATLMILAVLAVVIVINVLVGRIPGRLDLTQNKIYSLSPETYKVLDGLKTDVTVTTIGRVDGEDPTVKAILAKYAARNRHVKLQTIDPEMNPGWTKQYDPNGQGLSTGSLVVAAGTKYKTIGPYDMYNYDTSNYDPTNPNSQPQITSLSAEQRLTSALMFVTAEKNITLYSLEGHGEQTIDSLGLSTLVSNDNYAVKTVSLLTQTAVPAEANVLLILAPKTDLSAEDTDKVRSYLAGGGSAVVMMDVLTKANQFPNLAGILQTYGVEVQSVVVIEGDQNKTVGQNPVYLVPTLEYHDILSPLRSNNYDIVMPGAQAIKTVELKKKTLKIEPLLSSSSKSYGRPDITKSRSLARQTGDLSGPFTLAVAITDPAADPSKQDTKLIVVGNVQFLAPSLSAQVPGNDDFFMNSLAWLRGQKDTITIRAKSLQTMRLSLSNLQALIFSGIVVILLPLLVLGSGFIVWMRRRHL